MCSVGKGVDDAIVIAIGIKVIAHESAIGITGQTTGRTQTACQSGVMIALAVAQVVRKVERDLAGDVCVVEGPVCYQTVGDRSESVYGYGDHA